MIKKERKKDKEVSRLLQYHVQRGKWQVTVMVAEEDIVETNVRLSENIVHGGGGGCL